MHALLAPLALFATVAFWQSRVPADATSCNEHVSCTVCNCGLVFSAPHGVINEPLAAD